jgi:outer membrane protein
MKFILIIISLIFIIFNPSNANEIKIAYIDTDKILNESNAGKEVKKQLDIINKKKILTFQKIEKELIEQQKKISQQENILSKDELEKKVKEHQEKVIKFQNDVRYNKDDLIKKNNEATKKILDILNPVLYDYSAKNSITIIFQKNHIVIGRADLDITEEILKTINEKIKNIKLN